MDVEEPTERGKRKGKPQDKPDQRCKISNKSKEGLLEGGRSH